MIPRNSRPHVDARKRFREQQGFIEPIGVLFRLLHIVHIGFKFHQHGREVIGYFLGHTFLEFLIEEGSGNEPVDVVRVEDGRRERTDLILCLEGSGFILGLVWMNLCLSQLIPQAVRCSIHYCRTAVCAGARLFSGLVKRGLAKREAMVRRRWP